MLGVLSGQGDMSERTVEMVVDFPREASGRMEDKQRSMRIDEMSGVTRQTRAPE